MKKHAQLHAMKRGAHATTHAGLGTTILVLGLVLAGCGTSGMRSPGTAQVQSPPQAPADAARAGRRPGTAAVSALADTRWCLVEFQSMDDAIGTSRPRDRSLYTMSLDGDGTVTMRLDCNRATGTWSAEPAGDGGSGRFEFGQLAVTRALCPPPSMDESIAKQSAFIRSYLLKDGRLYLSLMADGGIYAWEPDTGEHPAASVAAAPEDGGPRNWEVVGVSRALDLRERPSATASVVASHAPGTILDNLGCERAGGGVWCDVQALGGGPRGYVSAEFLKPAVSPDGSVATGPDDSALRAGEGKFDATGTIPCAQSVGQPMTQCGFGVARAGGGYSTIVVTKPDRRTRAIFFRMGIPVGADTSQADGYPRFSATRESDLHLIRVGDERYEIPDAVVVGAGARDPLGVGPAPRMPLARAAGGRTALTLPSLARTLGAILWEGCADDRVFLHRLL